jgi:hypothetical protein
MSDKTNSDFIERIALLEDRCVPLQPFLKNVPIGDRTTPPAGSYRHRNGDLLLHLSPCRVHTSGKIGHDEHMLNDEDLATIKRWIPGFKVDPRREAPANSFLEQLPKIFEILLSVFGLKPDVVEELKVPGIIVLLDSREPTRTDMAIGSGDNTGQMGDLPGEFAGKLEISDTTLNKYAKMAGEPTPGQGGRNFRYTPDSERRIAQWVVTYSAASTATKHKCRSFLASH